MTEYSDAVKDYERRQRSLAGVHAAIANALGTTYSEKRELFEARVGPRSPHIATFEKAQVEPHTTSNTPLVATVPFTAAFAARARQRSLLALPFRTAPVGAAVNAVATGASDASWIGTNAPIRVSAMAFSRVVLPTTSQAVIVPVSQELARLSSAAAIIEDDLLEASARGVNASLLSQEDEIPGLRPAGLLSGITSIGDGSPASLENDVASLVRAVRGAEAERPYFVASRYGALTLATARSEDSARLFPDVTLGDGGSIWGIPVAIAAAAETRLVLVDCARVVVADQGAELGFSTASAFELSDSPAAGPAQQVSMFQTDSLALKVVRHVSWQRIFDDSVGFIELGVPREHAHADRIPRVGRPAF